MSDKLHHQPAEESALNQLWVSMTGASSGHGEAPPGLDATSQKVGHEPDAFGIKGIIAVPVAVVAMLILTYLVVTGVFAYVKSPEANLAAQKQKPYNERAGRISSTDPQAIDDVPTTAVPQPRLEYMKQVKDVRAGETVADPAYIRSFEAKEGNNNSPEIYPQFYRPENFIDPTSKRKALLENEWIDKPKGVAQISMSATIQLMISTMKPATKPGGYALVVGTLGQAKLSTGGRGGPSDPPSAAKPAHDHKH